MKKLNKGFTLIELIVSMVLFAIVIVIAFETLWSISKTRLSNTIAINMDDDLFYAVENLTTTIKDFNWAIDYEEYWNRKAVGITEEYWHYKNFSWYWNYWKSSNLWASNSWDWLYFCRSWVGITNIVWTWWCLTVNNSDWSSLNWIYQRFWEYTFQFIDYNFNYNNDVTKCAPTVTTLWDENCDTKIRWDDDDENFWAWPDAFAANKVKELYLIRKWKFNERLLLRLTYTLDPDGPLPRTCNADWSWNSCIWNIEVLRLSWRDYWVNHNWVWVWAYDWVIDTWQCDKDFPCWWIDTNNWVWIDWKMPTTNDSTNWWWTKLFPDYINVKDLSFFIYPKKDFKLAWKESDPNTNINPYAKININLWLSWWKRAYFKNSDPQVNISTTINLSTY